MHLVVRDRHGINDIAAAEDLALPPGDLVVLSFSDSDLAATAAAWANIPNKTLSLRLAPLARLRHPMSVDLLCQNTLRHAKGIIVRLLGGLDYWRYGAEQLSVLAREHGIRFVFIPGDGRPDFGLAALSTIDPGPYEQLFNTGGPHNIARALQLLAGEDVSTLAVPVPACGVYRQAWNWPRRTAGVYRSLWIAGDLAPVDAMVDELAAQGLGVTAVFVPALRAPGAAAFLRETITQAQPAVIVNLTAFSARDEGASPLDAAGVPVIQLALSLTSRKQWDEDPRGLSASCLAMNVVLPEVDGRIFAGAVSFKEADLYNADLAFAATGHRTDPEMVRHAAALAAAHARLGLKTPPERRIALVLSAYPGRSDQIAHAVGLDGPESAARILRVLAVAGYTATSAPHTGAALIEAISSASLRWPLQD